MFQWNRVLPDGPQTASFKKYFLQLTKDHVDSLPCDTDCTFTCPRRIVHHSENDIAAICDEGEPEIQVSRSDLLVYQLKQSALNKEVAAALDIPFKESTVDGLRSTWRIGEYVPTEGFRFPVFVTMMKDARAMLDVCRQLCHTVDSSFALIIPSRRALSPVIEEMLEQKHCTLCVLTEDFTPDKSALKPNREPEELFEALLKQVPEADSGGLLFFPTPAGITWEDIKIQFRDNHTVTVWAGNETRRFTYGEMGMISKKDKNPTVQWTWLQGFAVSHGEINWGNKHSAHSLKKQKQLLSSRLREFFRLDDDPIVWDKSSGTYCCRFTILPEGAVDG
jgi:hypothetical protein